MMLVQMYSTVTGAGILYRCKEWKMMIERGLTDDDQLQFLTKISVHLLHGLLGSHDIIYVRSRGQKALVFIPHIPFF